MSTAHVESAASTESAESRMAPQGLFCSLIAAIGTAPHGGTLKSQSCRTVVSAREAFKHFNLNETRVSPSVRPKPCTQGAILILLVEFTAFAIAIPFKLFAAPATHALVDHASKGLALGVDTAQSCLLPETLTTSCRPPKTALAFPISG